MSNSSLLQEYLQVLGWKIDAASYRRFNQAVRSTEQGVMGMGKSALWAGAAVAGALALAARQAEKLYFSSLKIGDSALNIETFGFAASQVGISMEHATGMLEGFANQLRLNPGKMALLEALGVHAKGAKGQLEGLVGVLTKMPFYVGAAYAEQFGISPQDLFLLEKTAGERARQERDAAAMAKNYQVDLTDAAQKAHEFDKALGSLGERFRMLGFSFVENVGPWFTDRIGDLGKLVDSTASLLADIRNWNNSRDGRAPRAGEQGFIPGQTGQWGGFWGAMADIGFVGSYGLMEAGRQGFDALGSPLSYQSVMSHLATAPPDYLMRGGEGTNIERQENNITIYANDPAAVATAVSGVVHGGGALGPDTARSGGTPLK